ncbi:MAG: hypothetical protein D3910_07935 [Candidatus Electrothrix sp. ATG2]|nr:hypothetical protein [Candidatus Electrothrix sp. ATG2]
MEKKKMTAAVSVLLGITLVILAGCSGEKEEAGVVEQASDKVAGKAAEYLNKPLDAAKRSQAVQNAENQKLENVVQESGE